MPSQSERDGGVADSRRDEPDRADLVELEEVGVELDKVDSYSNTEPAA